MPQTAWTAVPIVYSHGVDASLSWAANHAKPVTTMIGPTRFSGRLRQEARPQLSIDTPTTGVRIAPGSVGPLRAGGAASHVAPIAASAPPPATTESLAFITADCRVIRRRGPIRAGTSTKLM